MAQKSPKLHTNSIKVLKIAPNAKNNLAQISIIKAIKLEKCMVLQKSSCFLSGIVFLLSFQFPTPGVIFAF